MIEDLAVTANILVAVVAIRTYLVMPWYKKALDIEGERIIRDADRTKDYSMDSITKRLDKVHFWTIVFDLRAWTYKSAYPEYSDGV